MASSAKQVGGRRGHLAVLVPVILLALGASVWATAKTADHIGAGYDGASYLGSVAELRSGHGPTVPFTYVWDVQSPSTAIGFGPHVPSSHFPPGYALAATVVSTVSGTARSGARWLGVLLLFVNVVLVGVLTARLISYRSAIVASLPAVLLLFVPDTGRAGFLGAHAGLGWLGTYLGAYSEPLFTACATGAVLATGTAVTASTVGAETARRAAYLATSLAAGALLTRYAGVAVVLTVAAALALYGHFERARSRTVVAASVVGAASLPTLAFLLWTAAQGGGSARLLAYHPAVNNGAFVSTLGRFFFPDSWPSWIRNTGLAALAIGVLLAASPLAERLFSPNEIERRSRTLFRIAIIFVGSYFAVLFITRTFFDIETPFDARILSPVRGVIYALATAVAFRALTQRVRVGVVGIVLGLLCVGLIRADWSNERFVLDYGPGPKPARSTTEVALASLPKNALIVSNAPPVAYLQAGRRSLSLPPKVVYVTGKLNTTFERDMAEWNAILKTRESYVFFVLPPLSNLAATPNDLKLGKSLQLISHSGSEYLYKVVQTRPKEQSGPDHRTAVRRSRSGVMRALANPKP